MTTVREALHLLHQALAPHSPTAVLDAQAALAALLHRSRAWVLAHPEARLPQQAQAQLRAWTRRLARGEPLPYVLGRWEFYGRAFALTPDVLIPRPETETLVEAALEHLAPHARARVVDVGTGSGCIAITLALERPHLQVWATDRSLPALRVARRNREQYHLGTRVRLVQAHLLAPFRGPWDMVVANLPYIPSGELATLRVARWEPREALDGGPDGLCWIRALLPQALQQLRPQGHVFLEVAPSQAETLRAWVTRHWPQVRYRVYPDLRGDPRVVHLQKP